MRAWFRRLRPPAPDRWPLRDPAVREARDDYRDAQAAIREALERENAELRQRCARAEAALATALTVTWFYRGTARRSAGPDTEVTAVQPAYRGRR